MAKTDIFMVSSDLYIDLGETNDPNSFGLTRRKLSSVFPASGYLFNFRFRRDGHFYPKPWRSWLRSVSGRPGRGFKVVGRQTEVAISNEK